MPSKKQIEANRRNAKLSTGPKTPEGKAIVSQNSCLHGLRSREAVLPAENQAEFDTLLASFPARFQPADALEESLVRQAATADWFLRRIVRIQTGVYLYRIEEARASMDPSGERPDTEFAPTEEERLADDETFLIGFTYSQSCGGDALARLARYEAATRRAFYKALEQLNKRPPRPLATDDRAKPIPAQPIEAPPVPDPAAPAPLKRTFTLQTQLPPPGLSPSPRALAARLSWFGCCRLAAQHTGRRFSSRPLPAHPFAPERKLIHADSQGRRTGIPFLAARRQARRYPEQALPHTA